MQDDERCCGSGTCIIDTNGLCWCGQHWQGDQMCSNDALPSAVADANPLPVSDLNPAGDHP